MDKRIGSWAFIIGVVIAILAGIFAGISATYAGAIALVLVVLGLIVGFLNVSPKEATSFVIASVGLMAAGKADLTVINTLIPTLGTILQSILSNIVVFIAPAAIVVSLIAVKALAED